MQTPLLAGEQIFHVVVRARDHMEAVQVADPFCGRGACLDRSLDRSHVPAHHHRHEAGADLIVNTTPAGLEGTSPLTGFPRSGTGLAYDLVYFRTPFLDAAEAAGWKTLNGRDMFANQGGAQFTLWTGFPLPDAAFRAMDEAIARHVPL